MESKSIKITKNSNNNTTGDCEVGDGDNDGALQPIIKPIVVENSPTKSATTTVRNPEIDINNEGRHQLDFIGSSVAVKDLFALPYSVDRPISVAVHNLGDGTLLIDADSTTIGMEEQVDYDFGGGKKKTKSAEEKDDGDDDVMNRSLVALSSLEDSVSKSEALTIVNSVIESTRSLKKISSDNDDNNDAFYPTPTTAEAIAARYIPPTPEPREYLSWKFHDLNLLVGSDAIIYRSNTNNNAAAAAATSSSNNNGSNNSNALVVRVEDAMHMKTLLEQHNKNIQSGKFIADHRLAKIQQMGKPSYADATRKNVELLENENENENNNPDGTKGNSISNKGDSDRTTTVSTASGFAAPDLDQVALQTCIIPIEQRSSVSSLLRTPDNTVIPSTGNNTTDTATTTPISTVLDTYLDNIMANVPQLALCLREKGFIQSVKLLNTDEIPSMLLRHTTLDTTIPFEAIRKGGGIDTTKDDPADDIFSPQIMEMNAHALLRFLKTNCTKDNATYLLRRDAGHANIQLYDISAISSQRQQKWIWWLAMISYRFSHRLKHLSKINSNNKLLQRTFRVRQRSLLQNTLDLLETLADMNETKAHESLIAAVCENLADTYLVVGNTDDDDDNANDEIGPDNIVQTTKAACPISPPPQAVSSHQPYMNVTVDALSKAQDQLSYGIKRLTPVFDSSLQSDSTSSSSTHSSSNNDDTNHNERENNDNNEDRIDAVVTQMYGLNVKLVNVSLRLAELHMKNYFSSSAMQNLRTAANHVSESLRLVQLISQIEDEDAEVWLPKIQLQYTWLWEQCGHFARSFAADSLWRDRGHASGDDVISVLQDVEMAFSGRNDINHGGSLCLDGFIRPSDRLLENSNGMASLQALSGVVDMVRANEKRKEGDSTDRNLAITAAIERLGEQKLLQKDERRVLVAACVSYSRAVKSFVQYLEENDETGNDKKLADFLSQRYGDSCNETGKVMLNELRSLLLSMQSKNANIDMKACALQADIFCRASEFWFLEGLRAFEKCRDLRNLALLRCNLCQCCKLRANALLSTSDSKKSDQPGHAEICLQEAANHLQAAHEALETRDTDPLTWDMVSGELAATFLVLGVRRRQTLIGSGNGLMLLNALRLPPGKEKSIVDPIQRARGIYEKMGNFQQAAAANYQLAQFYSKIWTSQRDEAKTREKLAAAFNHYNAAYAYFRQAVHGNEATFCLVCLDLASLYATVSGEECLSKALLCCLDTVAAFPPETINTVSKDLAKRHEWLQQMDTIAVSVEERVLKLLKSLVKMAEEECIQTTNKARYKDLYRTALTAKMSSSVQDITGLELGDEKLNEIGSRLVSLQKLLQTIREQYERDFTNKSSS